MAYETLSISTGDIFRSSLRYIEKLLEGFKKNGAITTKITNGGGRSELNIAFDGVNTAMLAKLIETVQDAVADIVITDCKCHYIESTLKLPIEDEISRHAFIRALSGFDRAADKTIASTLINLTPNFLLDSFYTFSLDPLKARWQEVCALANDNACFLVCDGTFRELLRFLISNLESREPEVHLFQREDGVEVLTRALKPVNVYVSDELPADAQVVSKLISIAPKRIVLHRHCEAQSDGVCHSEPHGYTEVRNLSRPTDMTERTCHVIDFIQNLFGSCVQVVQN